MYLWRKPTIIVEHPCDILVSSDFFLLYAVVIVSALIRKRNTYMAVAVALCVCEWYVCEYVNVIPLWKIIGFCWYAMK